MSHAIGVDPPPPAPPGQTDGDPPPPLLPPPPHDGGVTGGVTGGTTTTGADTTEVVHELFCIPLTTVIVYAVVALDGGITKTEPDDPTVILPGLIVPVELLSIDQVSVVAFPFTTLFGFAVIIHEGGGVTGGTTTTGAEITDAVHELVPTVLFTVSTYGVVALIGGIITVDPDDPTTRFPGFRVPVRLLSIDQVSVAPLPFITLFGLIDTVQLGGTWTALLAKSAKYEK